MTGDTPRGQVPEPWDSAPPANPAEPWDSAPPANPSELWHSAPPANPSEPWSGAEPWDTAGGAYQGSATPDPNLEGSNLQDGNELARSSGRRAMGCAFEVIETLVLTLVIFFVVQTFIAQPFRVKGQSMQHSFENDQYVLVDKLTPHWDGYHRGDVVVLDPPRDFQLEDNEPFIKRIVGLPGEIVELRDGQVIINGTPLDESYTYNTEPTEPLTDAVRWVIGPNQVFVLGDHRQRSEDSRAFGPIDQKSIVGRAWLRYWPLTALGMVSGPPYPEPTK